MNWEELLRALSWLNFVDDAVVIYEITCDYGVVFPAVFEWIVMPKITTSTFFLISSPAFI